jgi:predicted nucleic acid-binding protein
MILCRDVDLAWSYVLNIEAKKMRDAQKRFTVLDWQKYAVVNITKSQKIRLLANEVQDKGIHKYDALHIACAIKANCQFFVTTDCKNTTTKEYMCAILWNAWSSYEKK